MKAFTPEEIKILAIVQKDLPYTPDPYAEIARLCGTTEDAVLSLLTRLRENGTIRRFGASVAHQKAGWNANAMVAWQATPEQARQCGKDIQAHSRISHAYLRPSPSPEWPYSFYTMIHGRSEAECLETVNELAQAWHLDYAILRSVRELKKSSPIYF